MTQSNIPDPPQDGSATPPESGASPVDHAAPPPPPPPSEPARDPAPPPAVPEIPPARPGPARGDVGTVWGDADGDGSGRSEVTRRSVVARLALVLPLLLGTLLVEGMFATRGQSGDLIGLPAAGLALLLLWMGIAWALRSWVVLLLTFVPAIMVTLGAAMVGSLAPGAGATLLLVGVVLVGAVISFRLSAPAHRWNSGWTPTPRGGAAAWPRPDAAAPEGRGTPDEPAGGDGAASRWPLRPLDPLGAHFLSPNIDPRGGGGGPRQDPIPQRPAPAWDTSRTDRAARDRLVALLCQRGGTTGPTLATVEEFFTGNGDPRSIAPGLRGAVPLATFAAVLHRMRSDRAVSELLVQVEPLEAGTYPAGEWPAAGGIHLICALGADEVDAMAANLHPEPAIGPLPADSLTSGARAPEGSGEFAIWWA